MGKTLFLHVGLQKTGTTSIQTCLIKNRPLLAEHGFVYPDPACVRIGLDDVNHGHLSLSLTGYWRDTPYQMSREEAWGELRSLYFESDGHLLISHEGLSTPQIIPHLKFIRRMLRGISTKVIIYLRRQDLFAQSVYKERLKAYEKDGFQESFDAGDYRELLDFYSILRAWQACIGKGNIIVRPFERGQLQDGDVVEDFLHATGMSAIDGIERLPQHENPTLTRTVLEISRALNAMGVLGPDITSFKQWLNEVLTEGQSPAIREHSIIGPQARLAILNDYRVGNEKIARRFLGRADGQLFYDALPDPDESFQPYQGISSDDVAKILAAMFDKYAILDRQGG